MAKLLVTYTSKNGQTRKIAHAIADELSQFGHQIDEQNILKTFRPNPDDYDGFVVGAPVYGGKYPKPIRRWLSQATSQISKKPSAFFSVCLGVLEKNNPQTQEQEKKIMESLLSEAEWKPALTKILPGALNYTKYIWPLRWMMKRIAKKAGGDTDTARDFEYTDWNEVRTFAREFHELISRDNNSHK